MRVRFFVSVRYGAKLLINTELIPVKVGKVLGTVELIVSASVINTLNKQVIDSYSVFKQFAERSAGLSRNRIVVFQICRKEILLR